MKERGAANLPMKLAKPSFTRGALLLLLLILGGATLLYSSVSGSSQCEAAVDISGRIVNERGEPLVGEEVKFTFYVSPYKRDVEITTETNSAGAFHVQADVPQSRYENFNAYCVEIQARMFLPGYDGEISYEPGDRQWISEESDFESWAGQGAYADGMIQLFHSVRMEDTSQQQSRFEDISIQLGSEEIPCLFQLGQKAATEEIEIRIRHLDGESGEQLAAEERWTHDSSGGQEQRKVYPKTISGMAPLRVTVEAEIMKEAKRGSPIAEYTVEGLTSQRDGEAVEVIFYYHMDRDGDGVPDYLVTESYVDQRGDALPGYTAETAVYAHKDLYQGTARAVTGYQYKGYKTGASALVPTLPEAVITSDSLYQLVYEKQGGGAEGPRPEPPPIVEPPKPPDETGGELPEAPEPEPPEQPEPEPQGPPEPSGETAQGEEAAAPPGSAVKSVNNLTAADREALRNVSFVKENYRKDARPGEEVPYGFRGFENAFPYALTEFTIVDEPDAGLDLKSIQLPAFREGAGLTYDVTYTTNKQGQRTMRKSIPADQEITLKPPGLAEGEYITAVAIRFGEVPPGFAKDSEIQMTFQVWENPPEEELHNLGFLYYSDKGEKVEIRSEDGPSLLTVRNQKQQEQRTPPENQENGSFHGGNKSLSKSKHTVWWIAAALVIAAMSTAVWKKRRKN